MLKPIIELSDHTPVKQPVVGHHLEDLLSHWEEYLINDWEIKILRKVLGRMTLDEVDRNFQAALEEPLDSFRAIGGNLLEYYLDYEELCAWQELLHMKHTFDSLRLCPVDFDENIKRYTLVITQIIPERLARIRKMPKREKIAGIWSNWDLEQTPLRHRKNYEIYRQRQSKRDEEHVHYKAAQDLRVHGVRNVDGKLGSSGALQGVNGIY
ncbi:hypothetical protein BGZ61DRAFT_485924 [Ilyonectria robusta]|uniref:uncharacterized protein n=1 Tax=Ilyonectria robusta TaxID=1079257 RepID=UPI001E8D91BD|nr:uncharacterized protein BGZ61DRAFT_485924 [Ilyonectria robusta]KAH8659490.1 hypothetical protein BGZ61DRAFT_485924 [Ilyonectria robusta]